MEIIVKYRIRKDENAISHYTISTLENIKSIDLSHLKRWLEWDFGSFTIIIFGLCLYYLPQLAFLIFLIIAVIFTPLLISVLFKEKCYGWLIFFLFFVVIPGGISYFLWHNSTDNGVDVLARATPIILFLLYCFLLRVSLPGMEDD